MTTNRLKKIVDRKSWEMLNPPPVASASGSLVIYDQASIEKDAIYLSALTTPYIYDHEQDAWVLMPNPAFGGTTPTMVGACGAYTPRGPTSFAFPGVGMANNVLSTPLSLQSNINGSIVRIIGGTGAGQDRVVSKTIPGQSAYTVTTSNGSSTVTLVTGNINNIVPGMALWQSGNTNIPVGTVVTAILTSTTFSVNTPAGGGTGITVGASLAVFFGGLISVSTPWTTVPDFSSVLTIYSGRYFAQVGAATLANSSIAFYDKATNLWQLGSTVGTLAQPGWGTALGATYLGGLTAWGTDGFMTSTPSNKTSDQNLIFGTSTGSNLNSTLNDTTKNWTSNTYRGYGDMVMITGGTGVGQMRYVIGNTINQLQVEPNWTTIPDNTSTYMIAEWTTCFSATAGASSNATTINGSFGTAGLFANLPIRIIGGTGVGGVGIITNNTTGALTVSGLATADATSVFLIKIPQGFGPFISNGTSNTSTQTNFASSIFASGHLTNAGYQMLVVAGTGAGQIRNIASNTATQITCYPALGTTLDATSTIVILSPFGAFTMGVTTSATGTTITANKNWGTNQWANYQVRIVAGTGAGAIRAITSNTANQLTVTLPFQYTAGTVTTTATNLVATLASGAITSLYPGMLISGNVNIPANSTVGTILSTTTFQINTTSGSTASIAANAGVATNFGTVPDTTSWFVIEPYDEQLFIGGNNAVALYKADLTQLQRPGTAVTVTAVTPGTARAGAPVAGSFLMYVAESGASQWQDETNIINGRRIYSIRSGATTTMDYYDLALNTWVSGIPYRNTGETFTTGTKAYGESGEIYIQKDATGRIFRFNVADAEMKALSTMLYPQGVAIVGNTMWLKKYTDGDILKYLYFIGNTATFAIRVLLVDRG